MKRILFILLVISFASLKGFYSQTTPIDYPENDPGPGGGGGSSTQYVWYNDNDGDGWGGTYYGTFPGGAATPPGKVTLPGDCDDNDASINEFATEIPGDGKDNNCNGQIDEGGDLDPTLSKWYSDLDGDGLGDSSDFTFAVIAPLGYVANGTDNCPTLYDPTNNCIGGTPAALSNENYVFTRTYQTPHLGTAPVSDIGTTDVIESVTYFDGLGRPMQQVAIRASNDRQDILTHIGYDDFGRQDKDWLPMVNNDGDHSEYRGDISGATKTFYANKFEDDIDFNNPNPFSQKGFESSPLNRVLKQGAPGNAWRLDNGNDQGLITFGYDTNTGNEVRLYGVSLTSDYTPTLTGGSSYYNSGEFYKTVTRDENHDGGTSKKHTTEEFTDKQGRVVLKRTYGDSDEDMNGSIGTNEQGIPHDTYYVYDDFGNLTYVIPPKASSLSNLTGSTSVDPTVYSEAVIGNGGNLNLTASESIVLEEGFHAKSGSTFTAHITPSAGTSILDELCYQYKYDGRNRLIEKKIPGKGWEYIVYNKLDQPIMTQDANMKAQNKWLFTKYDAFGRVIYTGIVTRNITRVTLQNEANNTSSYTQFEKRGGYIPLGGGTVSYTNTAYPSNSINSANNITELHTVNYYDTYIDSAGMSVPSPVYGVSTNVNTKTLPTVSKVRVLETSTWITSIMGYDNKGRVIFTKTNNPYLGTTDEVRLELDFVGKVVQSKTIHKKTSLSVEIRTEDSYTYDHMGRLEKHTQKINDGNEEVIVFNEYDELGQIKKKKVGGAPSLDGLQTIDYTYNIRGWLKSINNPSVADPSKLFAFKINYNTTEMAAGATPLYNGNISETIWRTANTGTNGNRKRGYAYQYDALNRIKTGSFRMANRAGTSFNEQTNNYNLSGLVYDLNGNITRLIRQGHTLVNSSGQVTTYGTMDNLTYTYNDNNIGNRLINVSDTGSSTYGFKNGNTSSAQEYFYDVNGNMTRDLNKDITGASNLAGVTYNHLNLPTEIKFSGSNTKKINYFYTADGTKLKKVVNENSSLKTTEYAGNFVYIQLPGSALALDFFNQPEGYIKPRNASNLSQGFEYYYQFKDHLGNIRLSYKNTANYGASKSLVIQEENNYYPFGLSHKGYNTNTENHMYKYNGVELEESLGLDLYEMDFRQYDLTIARFTSIDPVTHHSMSPYLAFDNNPVFWADPSGADADNYDPAKDKTLANLTGKITSNGGCTDCPAVNENNPIQLDEVYITNKKRGWTTEANAWDYGGTPSQYQSDHPEYAGMSNEEMKYQYDNKYGKKFDAWADWYGGQMRLAAFINRMKLGLYDNGALETLQYTIGIKATSNLGMELSPRAFNFNGGLAHSPIEVVHGNSLSSLRPTWGYKLYTNSGEFLKNGITSQLKAESRYTKAFMSEKYMEKQLFPNRRAAYDWEYLENLSNKGPWNKNMH